MIDWLVKHGPKGEMRRRGGESIQTLVVFSSKDQLRNTRRLQAEMRALEKGSLLALNGLVEPIGEGDGDGGMREGDAGVDV